MIWFLKAIGYTAFQWTISDWEILDALAHPTFTIFIFKLKGKQYVNFFVLNIFSQLCFDRGNETFIKDEFWPDCPFKSGIPVFLHVGRTCAEIFVTCWKPQPNREVRPSVSGYWAEKSKSKTLHWRIVDVSCPVALGVKKRCLKNLSRR